MQERISPGKAIPQWSLGHRERLFGGTCRETYTCELVQGPAQGAPPARAVVSVQGSSLNTHGAPGMSQALSGQHGAFHCRVTPSGRDDTQVEVTHPVKGALIESRELWEFRRKPTWENRGGRKAPSCGDSGRLGWGPWREGQEDTKDAQGARVPRTAVVGPSHLLDSSSEGPQDGRSATTVSLHPRHGGLGTAQMRERGVSGRLTSQQHCPTCATCPTWPSQTHQAPGGLPRPTGPGATEPWKLPLSGV